MHDAANANDGRRGPIVDLLPPVPEHLESDDLLRWAKGQEARRLAWDEQYAQAGFPFGTYDELGTKYVTAVGLWGVVGQGTRGS